MSTQTLSPQYETAPGSKRKPSRRVEVWYTCFCPRCNKPVERTDQLTRALNARDCHGLAALHSADVWVDAGQHMFLLRGTLDDQGRELDL